MILGVHASVTVGRRPDEVRAALDREGWPWLGQPGRFGTREVRLEGRPARSFPLRVASSRGVGRYGAIWRLRLERPDQLVAADPLLDLQLVIEPLQQGGTKLSLDGRVARDLGESAAATPRAATRLAASGYARSLLEQIATVLEALPMSGPEGPPPQQDVGATVRVWPARRTSRPNGA